MGRPIKKSKFVSDFGASTSAKIAVTAYRTFGGAKVDSTTAYIVSQRGSKKFKIHLDDSSEETMLLKAVAPASLANNNVNSMGEFMVQVTLDDSTVAYVEKFYNNTVHYVDASGNTGTIPYSLGQDPSGDFDLESGKGVVDIVSE
tara:strand:- start:662 stop:1096 length:435 start_codon:yes stop_codon:yes gene_type:complete